MKKELSSNLLLLINRRYWRRILYIVFKPNLFVSPFFFFPKYCQQSMGLAFEIGNRHGRWALSNDIVAYQHDHEPQINITYFSITQKKAEFIGFLIKNKIEILKNNAQECPTVSNRVQQCTTVQHVQMVKKLKTTFIGMDKERYPLWAAYLKTIIVRLGLQGLLPFSCATWLIQRLSLRNL
jgi:hypothetical protein